MICDYIADQGMSTHFKTIIFIVGVGLGIVVGEVSSFATEVAGVAMIVGVLNIIIHRFGKRSGAVGAASFVSLVTILFCIGLIIGIVRVQLVEEKNNFICEKSCTFDALIVSSPESKDAYQIFNVHPKISDDTVRDIQLRTPLYPKYKIGETLNISGKVNVPDVIPAHGAKKSFDYGLYLTTRNVGSEMFYPKIEIIDYDAHTIKDILGRWKESLILKINNYVSAPESALATGMLFGDSSLSKELTQTFRTAGLSHIIVLSGFNIAVVISFVLFVFTFLPLLVRITLASISVILFVMMVGGEASVIRATLMAFITLLATLLGRQYVAKQALIISLFLIVMYEPYALLHDVSLHLSFLATAGIVYLAEPFNNLFKNISVRSFKELFVTTLSAYVATLPYIMYTFGTVSVYALIANILALPFVPLAMLLSFIVVVMSYIFEILSSIFGILDTVIIAFILRVAEVIERLPMSSFTLTISFLEMCVMYVIIFLFVVYVAHRKENTTSHGSFAVRSETQSTYEDGVLTDIISY